MVDLGGSRIDLWAAKISSKTQQDGSILVWQEGELPSYPARLSDRIAHWATQTPDQIWMAERGPDGQWIKLTYREMFQQIRAIGQCLLDLNLSIDRPLLILSGNSIAHALMALGAQYVGVPSAAVAPAYALSGGDYIKLRAIRDQITPGAVFVDKAAKFMPAIEALFSEIALFAVEGEGTVMAWDAVLSRVPSQLVDDANAATGPDTIAKFMFTSGTTGSPKAVIQTQRMLCSNMAMVTDCFAYFRDEPPIFLDWAPWNHVASGSKVFNMTHYNGGTYYIDGGKPTAAHIGQTIANIHDVSPNWYFNVPSGYEMLVEAMQADKKLAHAFFKKAKILMYAGAAMGTHTWQALDQLAIEVTGDRALLCSGLGSTETAPFALFCSDYQDVPGNIGIPAKGLKLKLVPNGEKFEARLKGPSVTPGYWRNGALTAEAFDEDGYYCLGDALRFADRADASKGFFFDGRVAENFKMATGTWVAVGALRVALLDALKGIARDVVIVGEGRSQLTAMLVPFRPEAERIVENGAAMTDDELFTHPQLAAKTAELLGIYNKQAGGASLKVMRALFLTEPLDLDGGEVTDKGSVNQRAVLNRRADLAASLYGDGPNVIEAKAL